MGLVRRIARARLASQVIRRLRRAGVGDARYDTRAFVVRFTTDSDDLPIVLPLDGLFAQRVKGRKERRAQLERFVAGSIGTGLPESWSEVRPLLRPVLRGAVPATGISTPLCRPALPFLTEYVVVDRPDTMTYVAADQVTGWGVPAGEVFAAAHANLAGAVLHGVAREPTVVQFIDDGDAYWTSHLLLPGWLARLAEQVGGEPVAFAPERGTLLVTAAGSGHLPGLFGQAEVAYVTSPRALTPMAYVSDEDGRTVPYDPPPGDPMHDCVRRARVVQAMQEYARQAETLDDAAPLFLTGDGRTRTVLRAGALLPRADEVVVGDDVRPWAAVEQRLVRDPAADPPRWRSG